MYLDRKCGLNLSLSEITLLFDLSLYLDRTLAQRKAQRKAKSKVKVAHCIMSLVTSEQILQLSDVSYPTISFISCVWYAHPRMLLLLYGTR